MRQKFSIFHSIFTVNPNPHFNTYIGGTNGYDGDTLINAIKEAWSLKKEKKIGIQLVFFNTFFANISNFYLFN